MDSFYAHISLYDICNFSESYVDVGRCSIVVPDEMRCHDHIIIAIVTNDQVKLKIFTRKQRVQG